MWHRVLEIIWASLLLNFCILYSYILYLKCPLDMLLYQGLYLKNGATKSKNKGTFFSRTFKVWESKVPLLIDFMPSKRRYGRFVILSPGHGHNIKQNGHISETRQRNKKTRALFFQLLKFEKAKWPCFCISCFLSRDTAIFWFCPYFGIICFLSRVMAILWFCPLDMLFDKMAISRKRGHETIK